MGSVKEFLFQKLSVRIGYTVSSYLIANLINFLASQRYQILSDASGVELVIKDPAKMKMWLIGLIMVGGEFILHALHENVTLPYINKEAEKDLLSSAALVTPLSVKGVEAGK